MPGKGGRIPGAGRKSKAEELGLPRLLEQAITQAERLQLFRKLKSKALAGDLKAIELTLAYLYGKPRQSLEVSGPNAAPLDIGVTFVDYRSGLAQAEDGPGPDSTSSGQTEDAGNGPALG